MSVCLGICSQIGVVDSGKGGHADEIFHDHELQELMSVNTEEDKALLSPSIWKSKAKSTKDSEAYYKELLNKKVRGQSFAFFWYSEIILIKFKTCNEITVI